jgi:hypothetical protein
MYMETFVSFVVGLPEPLKAAIAIAVLALVRLVLAGRVPEEWLTELAGVLTTALIAVIELALGLIPPEFDAVVAAVLNLIAILIGTIFVVRAYMIVRLSARARGLRF